MTRQGSLVQQQLARISRCVHRGNVDDEAPSRRFRKTWNRCGHLHKIALVACVAVLLSPNAMPAQQEDLTTSRLLTDANSALELRDALVLQSVTEFASESNPLTKGLAQETPPLCGGVVDRSTSQRETDENLQNLIATCGLSLAFSIGLIITISTTRQATKPPQRILTPS